MADENRIVNFAAGSNYEVLELIGAYHLLYDSTCAHYMFL